jgi:hypothetical protein
MRLPRYEVRACEGRQSILLGGRMSCERFVGHHPQRPAKRQIKLSAGEPLHNAISFASYITVLVLSFAYRAPNYVAILCFGYLRL